MLRTFYKHKMYFKVSVVVLDLPSMSTSQFSRRRKGQFPIMQECLASLVNDKVDNGTDGHEHASTVFHKYVGADFEELQIVIKAKTGCILFSERWLS